VEAAYGLETVITVIDSPPTSTTWTIWRRFGVVANVGIFAGIFPGLSPSLCIVATSKWPKRDRPWKRDLPPRTASRRRDLTVEIVVEIDGQILGHGHHHLFSSWESATSFSSRSKVEAAYGLETVITVITVIDSPPTSTTRTIGVDLASSPTSEYSPEFFPAYLRPCAS
jgi:hypothetical protein